MISLDGWSIESDLNNPHTIYFHQNNIQVVRIMFGDDVRCFVEVFREDGGLECLANHYKSIEEAISYANTLLNIGV